MSPQTAPVKARSRRSSRTRREPRVLDLLAGPVYHKSYIPTMELISEEGLQRVEQKAEEILQEIGIDFREDPEVLQIWRDAGADVSGERVRFEKGMLRKLIQATAPNEYAQIARNPDRSVVFGGNNRVYAPAAGPPFVYDLDTKERRYAKLEDLNNFIKLAHMHPAMQHTAGMICEPMDVAVNDRHLDMMYGHFLYSDKPFMAGSRGTKAGEECLEMARIVFGKTSIEENACLIVNVSVNSPLVYDDTMLQALKVYARAGQIVMCIPFLMAGTTGPMTTAANIAQGLAETMAGCALIQLINPGCPVMMGSIMTSTDMRTGSLYRGPEAMLGQVAMGQVAKRLGLPFRGGVTGTVSKLADASGARESADGRYANLLSGAHFVLQGAGSLNGGLICSYEKFLLDCEHMYILQRFQQGIDLSDEEFGMDAFREIGPGEHYLGSAHTIERFKTGFLQTPTTDLSTYEQWVIEGEVGAQQRTNNMVKQMLEDYEEPGLDAAVNEELLEFMAKRRSEN